MLDFQWDVRSRDDRSATARLMRELEATGHPRVIGGGEKFDRYPYRKKKR